MHRDDYSTTSTFSVKGREFFERTVDRQHFKKDHPRILIVRNVLNLKHSKCTGNILGSYSKLKMLKASRIHEWVAGFYHSIHVGVHGDSIGSECVAGSVVEVPRSESLSRIFEMLRKHVHQLTDSARLFDAKIPAKNTKLMITFPSIEVCARGELVP